MSSGERGSWGSRAGFILAAAGSAVGLGNIWGFPTKVGQGGGAVFVLVYLVCVFLICAPIMIAEMALGRGSQRDPVGAYRFFRPQSSWWLVGAVGILCGVGILSFYAVIAGWTVAYIWFTGAGMVASREVGEFFNSFVANRPLNVGLTFGFLAVTALSIVAGVREDGRREILAVEVADTESAATYEALFRRLKGRGLHGVRLVTSDDHAGLQAAIARHFQGAGWQRCRVHFLRNALALVPKAAQQLVAATLRTVFAQPTAEQAHAQWRQVAEHFRPRFPRLAALMDDAEADVIASTRNRPLPPSGNAALTTSVSAQFPANTGFLHPLSVHECPCRAAAVEVSTVGLRWPGSRWAKASNRRPAATSSSS